MITVGELKRYFKECEIRDSCNIISINLNGANCDGLDGISSITYNDGCKIFNTPPEKVSDK